MLLHTDEIASSTAPVGGDSPLLGIVPLNLHVQGTLRHDGPCADACRCRPSCSGKSSTHVLLVMSITERARDEAQSCGNSFCQPAPGMYSYMQETAFPA